MDQTVLKYHSVLKDQLYVSYARYEHQDKQKLQKQQAKKDRTLQFDKNHQKHKTYKRAKPSFEASTKQLTQKLNHLNFDYDSM